MPHQPNSESVDNVFSKLYIYIYCILSYCTVLDLPTARIYHPFKIQQKEELKHSTLPLWQPYLSSLIFVTTHAAWNCNFHSAHASKTKPRDPVPQPNEKTDSLTDWFATRPMFDESPQDPMEPEFLNQHSPECIACSYSIWAAAGHACLDCILHLSLGPRLRISNPQVIAGISTRRVGRKASIVESLGVFLGGSGLWVGCNHVCDASQQPILNPTLILQWFWRKLSKLVMGAYCDKRNVNKGGNHDGTLTRYRSITAAEPCAVVILEACPVVTPWRQVSECRSSMSQNYSETTKVVNFLIRSRPLDWRSWHVMTIGICSAFLKKSTQRCS